MTPDHVTPPLTDEQMGRLRRVSLDIVKDLDIPPESKFSDNEILVARNYLGLLATIDDRDKALSALKAENARLEREVYVPGQWRCAKCKFTLQRTTIDVAGGRIGVSERDRNEPEQCPNGCGPLWRVSERDAGNEVSAHFTETMDELMKALGVDCYPKIIPAIKELKAEAQLRGGMTEEPRAQQEVKAWEWISDIIEKHATFWVDDGSVLHVNNAPAIAHKIVTDSVALQLLRPLITRLTSTSAAQKKEVG